MQYTRTQAQNEQLPVQHFDKIRHHCPIIAKSFLAFIPRLKPWAFPPDFCKVADLEAMVRRLGQIIREKLPEVYAAITQPKRDRQQPPQKQKPKSRDLER